MATASIRLVCEEDGGNPRNPADIIQEGARHFTLRPFSEDGDPNYKFRLETTAFNPRSEPVDIDLTIDWQDTRFNAYREVVYYRNAMKHDWQTCLFTIDGPLVRGRICLDPGRTRLCLNPRYGYDDYLRRIESIATESLFETHYLGDSPGGRTIWGISIGANKARPRRTLLIVARIHPYESAGSFCIEGMIDHIKQAPDILGRLADRNIALYLIPMANPDGVYEGLCKRTAAAGIDLSKTIAFDHLAVTPIVNWIDYIQPDSYVELHNWMLPEWDGIYYMNRYQALRFTHRFKSGPGLKKDWKLFFKHKLFSIPKHGLKQYCVERFKSKTAVLEFSWRNRSTRHMRYLGTETLRALVKTFC